MTRQFVEKHDFFSGNLQNAYNFLGNLQNARADQSFYKMPKNSGV